MDERSAWIEPGAFEVVPGVHRMPLPLPQDGLRAVNVYAIAADDGLVLVDAGWALDESERQLELALKDVGAGFADITRFLVTHVHRDHYTQAITIRRRFGTRVSLGVGERPSLESSHDEGEVFERRLHRCGAQPVIDAIRSRVLDQALDPGHWEAPDDWLEDGTGLALGSRDLRALHTPGHTRGHLVFADDDNRLLFAGDHVLPHITPSIGFEPVPGPSPLADYLRSLAVVRAMPDLRLLPAHGPVAPSTHARIDELLVHHEARLDISEAAVTAGAATAYEAARAMTWTRRERHLDDLDPFNQMLATTETAAHLEVLVARGRLTRTTTDSGVDQYELG